MTENIDTEANFQSPWPHRVAIVLCCATFPLIWVGGLVTTYDAGLAVPDWPSTYGYNLFLYPISTWVSGPFDIFVEHGHRLLAATVGLISICLVAVFFRYEDRNWARALAIGCLLTVIVQDSGPIHTSHTTQAQWEKWQARDYCCLCCPSTVLF